MLIYIYLHTFICLIFLCAEVWAVQVPQSILRHATCRAAPRATLAGSRVTWTNKVTSSQQPKASDFKVWTKWSEWKLWAVSPVTTSTRTWLWMYNGADGAPLPLLPHTSLRPGSVLTRLCFSRNPGEKLPEVVKLHGVIMSVADAGLTGEMKPCDDELRWKDQTS